MDQSGVVPPPPWSPPAELFDTDTEDYSYHFVCFTAKGRDRGEFQELMVGLRRLPETLMLFEMSDGYGDVYALFRVGTDNASDRRLSDWIDIMAGQRIYNRLRTGWVRSGNEMVRFAR